MFEISSDPAITDQDFLIACSREDLRDLAGCLEVFKDRDPKIMAMWQTIHDRIY